MAERFNSVMQQRFSVIGLISIAGKSFHKSLGGLGTVNWACDQRNQEETAWNLVVQSALQLMCCKDRNRTTRNFLYTIDKRDAERYRNWWSDWEKRRRRVGGVKPAIKEGLPPTHSSPAWLYICNEWWERWGIQNKPTYSVGKTSQVSDQSPLERESIAPTNLPQNDANWEARENSRTMKIMIDINEMFSNNTNIWKNIIRTS